MTYKTIDLGPGNIPPQPLIVGVGGTARAALRIAQYYYGISDTCHSITADQLNDLCDFPTGGQKAASDRILQFPVSLCISLSFDISSIKSGTG